MTGRTGWVHICRHDLVCASHGLPAVEDLYRIVHPSSIQTSRIMAQDLTAQLPIHNQGWPIAFTTLKYVTAFSLPYSPLLLPPSGRITIV